MHFSQFYGDFMRFSLSYIFLFSSRKTGRRNYALVCQVGAGTLSLIRAVVMVFCLEFTIFCYTIFRVSYYIVFNIIQKQNCQCYLDAVPAYCLKFARSGRTQNSKMTSIFCYEFAMQFLKLASTPFLI